MMQAPEWDAADRQGSLSRWIDALNDEARRQFLQDGTHVEIFFIFNDEGLMQIVPVAGMEKDQMVAALKDLLEKRNGYAFIHISEGTMQHMDRADRADALLVHAESRDGISVLCCSTVAERNGEKLLLDAVRLEGDTIRGRFARVFDGIDGCSSGR
jgi:hypothetical protein